MKPIAALAAGIAAIALLGGGMTGTAFADKPSWAGKGGKDRYDDRRGRDDDDRYDDRRRGKHKYKGDGRRYGGPPPWAPAHGYRAKHRWKYRQYGHDYYATEQDLVILPTIGLGSCNREVVGGLLGAAAGGYLGSQIGSGSGRTAAVIGGTILGVLVGGNIGRSMDRIDQNCVGQALERAQTGQPVAWQNPDNGRQYQVTPTRTFEQNGGQYCREYQTKIIIDGRTQDGYGKACRQPDGSWKRM